MTPRPSPIDFQATYTQTATVAMKIFNEHGRVKPFFALLFLNPASEGQIDDFTFMEPAQTSQFYKDDNSKDLIKPFLKLWLADDSPLRQVLRERGQRLPDLVVQVAEAWVANEPVTSVMDLTKMKPPSERPDRSEAILVAVHAKDQTVVGYCPVVDSPTRHVEFAPPFEEVLYGCSTMQENVVH